MQARGRKERSEGELLGPASRFYISQRLRLHYVDWGNRAAPPLVLMHGGRDHARSWDWIAGDLRRDYHVIAPDLRGHGDSAWAIGSLYHLAEFVIDLAQLIDALGHERVTLMGHSFGSSVCAAYAGANPERVERFVAIEGIDLPDAVLERIVFRPAERVSQVIEMARQQAGRTKRPYKSIEAAAARMREENTFLSEEQALHLTEHGVARNEDGTYSWKFDDYARGPKLFRFGDAEMRELVGRIECATLLVRGTESETPDPERSGLLHSFQNARAVAVSGAGHWVHHDRTEELLRLVRDFLVE